VWLQATRPFITATPQNKTLSIRHELKEMARYPQQERNKADVHGILDRHHVRY